MNVAHILYTHLNSLTDAILIIYYVTVYEFILHYSTVANLKTSSVSVF